MITVKRGTSTATATKDCGNRHEAKPSKVPPTRVSGESASRGRNKAEK